jgi:serine/threonine protein phosphatase 1
MNKRRFVIGDIHGCAETFKSLLHDDLEIAKEDEIYLLGDYIDRGIDSKGVVDEILRLRHAGYDIYAIMGNHEYMLLDSIDSIRGEWNWMMNGAKSTLKSFGTESAAELDSKYLDFFRELDYYYLLDDFAIVHGGFNFELDNPLDDKYSMVWIRNEITDTEKLGGRRVIVGHTPRPLEHIRKTLAEDKIMLDGGCVYYGLHPGLGHLCALELGSMELFTRQNIDQPL